MKKYILILSLLAVCFGHSANAQINVRVNLGVQPEWGPVGYDYAEYYYIPDIDAYYDVNSGQYVYFENNYWVTRPYLPPRYRDFDLYHSYKVVINEQRPWVYHDRYRSQYARYRGHYDQHMIRDNRHYEHHDNGWHGGRNEWHGNDHQPHREYGGREQHDNRHGGEGRGHEGHGEGGHGHGEGGHGRR